MINEFKHHPIKVGLLLSLLLIKFIVLPVFDWQNEQILILHQSQIKLSKTQAILAKESQMKNLIEQISKNIEPIERAFFNAPNELAFKLNLQQQIESTLSRFNLEQKNFSWLNKTHNADLSLTAQAFEVRLTGDSYQLVHLISELEAQDKLFQLLQFNVDFKAQTAVELGRVEGVITFRVFWREAG